MVWFEGWIFNLVNLVMTKVVGELTKDDECNISFVNAFEIKAGLKVRIIRIDS